MKKHIRGSIVQLTATVLLAALLLTSCTSKEERAQSALDLGQKYLTELNYAEAILSFTEAIKLDPENIPAYMGRAEAYRGTEQYEEAKADYTTVIEKTSEQPYIQATAYVGRAEVNEQTSENQEALQDYEAASTALDTVEAEKLMDVTEQMLEALKIKVYNAYARLSAFFGRYEAAVIGYTHALDSLARLPDDAEVLDVKEEKITSYSGRVAAYKELEQYEAVLPDYDALIELEQDKTSERDTLLAALSLAKSKAADLDAAKNWLDEVNHTDYAEDIQLVQGMELLYQTAALAQEKGNKAYDEIKAVLNTDEAKQSMRNLLARGYQLRYYDEANEKMLAVYVGETAWPNVNAEENGIISVEDLEEQAVASTEAEVDAITISPLYVYYGEHESRSREGEGIWFILDPGTTDLTVQTYQWENDAPKGGFEKKVEVRWVTYSNEEGFPENYDGPITRHTTITYGIGGKTIKIHEEWIFDATSVVDIVYDTTFTLSNSLQSISQLTYGAEFYVPVGTIIKGTQRFEHNGNTSNGTLGFEAYNMGNGRDVLDGYSLSVNAGDAYSLNYAGIESYGVTFAAN